MDVVGNVNVDGDKIFYSPDTNNLKKALTHIGFYSYIIVERKGVLL